MKLNEAIRLNIVLHVILFYKIYVKGVYLASNSRIFRIFSTLDSKVIKYKE